MTRFPLMNLSETTLRRLLACAVAGWLTYATPARAQEDEAPAAPRSISSEDVEEEPLDTPASSRIKPVQTVPSRTAIKPAGKSGVRPRPRAAVSPVVQGDESTAEGAKPSSGAPVRGLRKLPARQPVAKIVPAFVPSKDSAWAEPVSPTDNDGAIEQVEGESLLPQEGLQSDSSEAEEGLVAPKSVDGESSDEAPAPLLGGENEVEVETEEPTYLPAPGEPTSLSDVPELVDESEPIEEEAVEPAPLRQRSVQPKRIPQQDRIDRTAAVEEDVNYQQAVGVGTYGSQDQAHVVAGGESFWSIAKKHYRLGRYSAALAEYNKSRIPKPDKIKPGMTVIIPPVETLEKKFPQLISGFVSPVAKAAPAAPVKSGFFIDADGQPMYRVGEGDTLSDIAHLHLGRSSRWPQIVALNKDQLPDPDEMKLGMVLRLPADASEAITAE